MTVGLSPADLAARVRARLEDPEAPCDGLATESQIELRIRERDRRFWSPQLVVIMKPDPGPGGATRLVGHFGPNGNVWTMFMAAYGFVVLSALNGAFFGFGQMMIGEPAWALWCVPGAVLVVALIYIAAGVGQRLGHHQVDVLLQTLEAAIGDEPGYSIVEAPFDHEHDGAGA